MKYRKKPVVIEAFQYDGDLINSNGVPYVPEWMLEAPHYYDGEPPCELYVKTLEGDMHVSVGDYVIRGINGEIYPCKPDIFVKTYEQANSSQDGEQVFLTDDEIYKISGVFQNHYCESLKEIAEEDETCKSLFEKVGLL